MATQPLSEGAHIPEVTLKTRVRDESIAGDNPYRWQDISSKDIFGGKKVVIFGLPGAFTPTCSSTHLPGFEKHYDDLKEAGVDEIYCVSVNDAFVMKQWADKLGVKRTKLLPDGNADFTKAMGMLVEKSNLGFGNRSWRYSAFIENGIAKKIFIEPGLCDNADNDPFEVSDAETMLGYLKQLPTES